MRCKSSKHNIEMAAMTHKPSFRNKRSLWGKKHTSSIATAIVVIVVVSAAAASVVIVVVV